MLCTCLIKSCICLSVSEPKSVFISKESSTDSSSSEITSANATSLISCKRFLHFELDGRYNRFNLLLVKKSRPRII